MKALPLALATLFISAPILAESIQFNVVDTGEAISDGTHVNSIEGWALTSRGAENVKTLTKITKHIDGGYSSNTAVIRNSDNAYLEGNFVILGGLDGLSDFDPKQITKAKTTGDFESSISINLYQENYVLKKTLSENQKLLSIELYLNGKETDKQTLYSCETGSPTYPHCGDEGFQELIWAGDIDGDKKLDLVLTLSKKYSHYPYYLYLSKGTESGLFLQNVAYTESFGC